MSTPARKASTRANPDGANAVHVAGDQAIGQHTVDRFVEVTTREGDLFAVRHVDSLGQLVGGHAGQTCGRSPAFVLSSDSPPRCFWTASMYRDTSTEKAV